MCGKRMNVASVDSVAALVAKYGALTNLTGIDNDPNNCKGPSDADERIVIEPNRYLP